MAGIVVELMISWFLLWLIYKKNLGALGIMPTNGRLKNVAVGILLAASCCILYQLMTTAFANNNWTLNEKLAKGKILQAVRWTVISVLYEELIFRGALLYIAIRKLGAIKACILSAVCFGIYHWFTFNVIGNPFMMTITFFMTAIVGLSWAFAFAKTGSLYLPIALHLGWNIVQMVIFSNGSAGNPILVRVNENKLTGAVSLLVFLFQVFALPLLTFWYLHHLSKKQTRGYVNATLPGERNQTA